MIPYRDVVAHAYTTCVRLWRLAAFAHLNNCLCLIYLRWVWNHGGAISKHKWCTYIYESCKHHSCDGDDIDTYAYSICNVPIYICVRLECIFFLYHAERWSAYINKRRTIDIRRAHQFCGNGAGRSAAAKCDFRGSFIIGKLGFQISKIYIFSNVFNLSLKPYSV